MSELLQMIWLICAMVTFGHGLNWWHEKKEKWYVLVSIAVICMVIWPVVIGWVLRDNEVRSSQPPEQKG